MVDRHGGGKMKTKALVDGRWTLAFKDEESCKSAFSMILNELHSQSTEVERRLKPLLFDDDDPTNSIPLSNSSSRTFSNPL